MASRASKVNPFRSPYANTATEHCILCGCLTDVLICQDVHSRKFYIEGAGQLCRDCYEDLYSGRTHAVVALRIKRRKFSSLLHSLFRR
jgi:hypothetical protein